MKVELTEHELALIKISLSNWHCVVTLESMKTKNHLLAEASSDLYNLMKKLEGL